jgi:PAS domain S-box-containing protein
VRTRPPLGTRKHTFNSDNNETLAGLQNKYQNLVENLKIGVYRNTSEPGGHFLEANSALIKMFGAKSKEDLMKHPVSDLYEDPKGRSKFMAEIIKKGEVKDWENNFITLNGKKFVGSVTAVKKVDKNGEIYFDGIVENVTRRKKMERQLLDDKKTLESRVRERTQELRELNRKQFEEIAIRSKVQNLLMMNNEELEKTKKAMLNVMDDFEAAQNVIEREKTKDEAILASIGDGVVVVNRKMKIIFFNRAAEKATGWKRRECRGKLWQEIINLKTEDGTKVPINKSPLYLAIHGRHKTTYADYLYTRKNGTVFPTAITVSSVFLNRKLIGAIVVFRNITREKEIDRAKSEFVSLASHQLRTPLGITKWYLEALARNSYFLKSPPEVLGYFNEVHKSNERVLSLVRELLSVSRIDQGRVKNTPKLTDVKLIVMEIVQQMQIIAHKKDINLKLIIKNGNIPQINIDSLRLHETVENLTGNALEYTTIGGLVIITLKRVGNLISISFKDTGMGISEGDRKNLFTKFFRSEEAIKNNPEGSGLGLYVVKSYVEGWGGEISVESTYGKGSTFTITLPIAQKGGDEG